jgi:type II secretory pathway component PulJ
MLAMAVMCMLSLALYASLRTAIRSKDRAMAAVEPSRAAQIAMDLIGRDLESALPPRGILEQAFQGVDGGSEAGDTLSFCAVQRGADDIDPTRNDGVKGIELAVEAVDDGSQCLVRRVTRNLLAQQRQEPEGEILCRDVAVFDVHYFADEVWYDEWDSTTQDDNVPAAVEVTLEIRKAGEQRGYRITRMFSLACHIAPDSVGGGQ